MCTDVVGLLTLSLSPLSPLDSPSARSLLVQNKAMKQINERAYDMWSKSIFPFLLAKLKANSDYARRMDEESVRKKFESKANFPHVVKWLFSQKTEHQHAQAKVNKPQTGAPAEASEPKTALQGVRAVVFGGAPSANLAKVCFESGGAEEPRSAGAAGSGGGGGATAAGSSGPAGPGAISTTTAPECHHKEPCVRVQTAVSRVVFLSDLVTLGFVLRVDSRRR